MTLPRRELFVVACVSFVVGLVLIASRAAHVSGGQGEVSPPAISPVAIDDAHLDFGEVWESDSFIWSLPVQNRSSRPIRIVEFMRSCSCLSIEPRGALLAPGETASFKATLDLSAASSTIESPPVPVSPPVAVSVKMAAKCRFADDETDSHLGAWVLHGRVRKVLALTPPRITFGYGLIVGVPHAPAAVTINAHPRVHALSATCDSELGVAKLKRSTGGQQEWMLEVTLAAPTRPGPFSFKVSLEPFGESGEPLPVQSVTVDGSFMPDIQPEPAAIAFGLCRAGQTAESEFALRSLTGHSFEVERIEGQPGGVFVVDEHSSATVKQYRVQVKITQSDSLTGKVVAIVRNHGSTESSRIDIPVTCLGISK